MDNSTSPEQDELNTPSIHKSPLTVCSPLHTLPATLSARVQVHSDLTVHRTSSPPHRLKNKIRNDSPDSPERQNEVANFRRGLLRPSHSPAFSQVRISPLLQTLTLPVAELRLMMESMCVSISERRQELQQSRLSSLLLRTKYVMRWRERGREREGLVVRQV